MNTEQTAKNQVAAILIIDDEESLRYTFETFLKKEGYRVHTAGSFDEAMACIETHPGFDLIFADIILPGSHTGIDFLRQVRKKEMDCPVIMITGQPELDSATEAVRQGAFDYVPKPVRRDTLLRLTRSALKFREIELEKRRIEKDNEQVRRHMDAVFQSVSDAIITLDSQGQVISANKAVTGICGMAPEQLTGLPLARIHSECGNKCGWIIEQTLKTQRAFRDTRIECPAGDNNQTLVTVNSSALMDDSGRQMGAVLVIRDITRIQRLERELRERREFRGIIGKSKAMQNIYHLLKNLSDLDTTVLITGESGTGKELIAKALHAESRRCQGPLVKVNCSALSPNLLESELFGHVKGAFTGATKDKAGRFEMAHGGTLLLDEIGDIAPDVQLKLLRVLQEKEIERVGETVPRKVDVRVISATNQDLGEKIRQGLFREDLFYRLKVMQLHLPPLRERREDIPLLMEHFRNELNTAMHRSVESFSDEAMAACLHNDWPGNIRQLKHCLEHAFVLCRDPEIRLEHLPPEAANVKNRAWTGKSADPGGSSATGETLDREALERALETSGWNKAKAARILGVSRQTLYRKLREFHIAYTQSRSD